MLASPLGHLLFDLFCLTATIVLQGAIFLPLACLFPSKKSQPLFRLDMLTDLTYYFFAALAITPLNMWFLTTIKDGFHVNPFEIAYTAQGQPLLHGWNLALHFVMAVALVDFIQYWMHRLLHGRRFWKIHSIHHCSPNVDWLSNNRSHPLNYILFICVAMDVAVMLGFDPYQSAWVLIFYGINSCLVHANLNWTYGPLRYVFASPVFHRWHHTSFETGGNKNFSAVFSFLDYIFGTFYMPKGVIPLEFGTPNDPIPGHVFGQLLYPFRRAKSPAAPHAELTTVQADQR